MAPHGRTPLKTAARSLTGRAFSLRTTCIQARSRIALQLCFFKCVRTCMTASVHQPSLFCLLPAELHQTQGSASRSHVGRPSSCQQTLPAETLRAHPATTLKATGLFHFRAQLTLMRHMRLIDTSASRNPVPRPLRRTVLCIFLVVGLINVLQHVFLGTSSAPRLCTCTESRDLQLAWTRNFPTIPNTVLEFLADDGNGECDEQQPCYHCHHSSRACGGCRQFSRVLDSWLRSPSLWAFGSGKAAAKRLSGLCQLHLPHKSASKQAYAFALDRLRIQVTVACRAASHNNCEAP